MPQQLLVDDKAPEGNTAITGLSIEERTGSQILQYLLSYTRGTHN